jgi:Flp pilus assembly protein protease CpaA
MFGQAVDSVASVPLLVILAAGLAATFTDLRSFRIPNVITIPLFFAGIGFHALTPIGQGGAFALWGALAGLACLLMFYVLGGVGAGDVKLLAASGAWVGFMAVLVITLIAAIFAGLYALVLVWRAGTWHESTAKVRLLFRQGLVLAKYVAEEERVEEVVKNDNRRARLIPFAAMVLGGIAVLVVLKFMN